VQCKENILGTTFIDISLGSPRLSDKVFYLHSKDTVNGTYVAQFKRLDSNAKKALFQKLNDLKNTVDSIVRTNDSGKGK
jgi:hypothetical protein